jgi:hypothetical protein
MVEVSTRSKRALGRIRGHLQTVLSWDGVLRPAQMPELILSILRDDTP